MMDDKDRIEEKTLVDHVMKHENGREFIWNLLGFCGLYDGIVGDSEYVQRMLGRREVALHLLGMISDHDEEAVFKMMREAQEKQKIKEKQDAARRQKTRREDVLSEYRRQDEDDYEDRGLPTHDYGGAII